MAKSRYYGILTLSCNHTFASFHKRTVDNAVIVGCIRCRKCNRMSDVVAWHHSDVPPRMRDVGNFDDVPLF
jgi:hypothetical protein